MNLYTTLRCFSLWAAALLFVTSYAPAQDQPLNLTEVFKSNVVDGVKKQLKLEWNFSNDADIKMYAVQRSSDKENFVSLINVDIAQKPNSDLFSFVDATPLSGVSFYRIKKIKADGSFSFSTVLPVSNAIDKKYALSLYPNPTGTSLSISAQGSQPQGQITINNMDGRQLFSIKVLSSSVETALDVSYLASGTYLLIYSDAKGEVVKQFIRN